MTMYQKTLTINETEKKVIIHCSRLLFDFMFDKTPYPIYFRLRLKDSEKNPFAKDLLLEWEDGIPEEKIKNLEKS